MWKCGGFYPGTTVIRVDYFLFYDIKCAMSGDYNLLCEKNAIDWCNIMGTTLPL